MKVERKVEEPKFVPIVITLESEAEANLMWHLLNETMCLEKAAEKRYAYPSLIEAHRFRGSNANTGMWQAFNEVYRPKDVC
jgi:hypothetical protein